MGDGMKVMGRGELCGCCCWITVSCDGVLPCLSCSVESLRLVSGYTTTTNPKTHLKVSTYPWVGECKFLVSHRHWDAFIQSIFISLLIRDAQLSYCLYKWCISLYSKHYVAPTSPNRFWLGWVSIFVHIRALSIHRKSMILCITNLVMLPMAV